MQVYKSLNNTDSFIIGNLIKVIFKEKWFENSGLSKDILKNFPFLDHDS